MADKATNSGGRCSLCGHSPLEPKHIEKTFDYGAADDTVTVKAHDVPVRQCGNCGEIYSGPEAAFVEHEAICGALGLEPPSKIKALREQFGWSQKYLADLAEIGIATLSRIERGRLVQSRSVNGILRDLRDCPPFRTYREGMLAGNETKHAASSSSVEPPEHHNHANRLGGHIGAPSGYLNRVQHVIKLRHIVAAKEQNAVAVAGNGFDPFYRSDS